MKLLLTLPLLFLATVARAQKPAPGFAQSQVQVTGGTLAGAGLPGGIHIFRGVPYAAPPVGERRWQAPQPAPAWVGVRPAVVFGPRPMQQPLFSDMNFRSPAGSEDCLYLNVWTGAKSAIERRPVLVYFYGGGFVAGDGSEYRYDGESLARRGLVTVTVNYRLGVFGFLAHPALTEESAQHASGNYGLLDQAAALAWVRANIAAFGGDPQHITIGGESAGSYSVSAQMASPLAKHLLVGAIAESGSLLAAPALPPLAEAEGVGSTFAAGLGAGSLAALRALPAAQLLAAAGHPGAPRFGAIVDGYFLPQQPRAIFAAGQQAQVPLLVGWNSQESGYQGVLGEAPPTLTNYRAALQKLYGDRADAALRAYPAATDAQVAAAATDLATDRFIAYGTWKLATAQAETGGRPVYEYLFARARPALRADPAAPLAPGAVHSAEIEYALGNLATNEVYNWQKDDYQLSKTMEGYFANFIRSGNPNGAGLPSWTAINRGTGGQRMLLDAQSHAVPLPDQARYLFLEQALTK